MPTFKKRKRRGSFLPHLLYGLKLLAQGLVLGLYVALLDGVQEDTQEQSGEEDANGVSQSGVEAAGGVQELAQALVAQHEVGNGYGGHEGSGNGGDPVVLLLIEQEHGSTPQNDHSQGLVGPAEVTPDDGVVDLAQGVADAQEGTDAQNGNAQQQTVLPDLLVDVEPVSQHQTGGPESGVAGGDGAGDNAQHSQSDANAAHGLLADVVNSGGTAAAQGQQLFAGVQGAAGSSPDQGNDAFGNHGAVEHEVALLLTLQAASHQGALGGMEAGNSAASHGDEHEAPDGSALRMHVIEVAPDLGDLVALGEDTQAYADGHDDQADAEDGVDLADQLVDGQEGGDEVVDQDQDQPEHLAAQNAGGIGAQQLQQASGANSKHGADHDQQNHGEHTHYVLHGLAQVDAGDFGDGDAVIPLGQHTGEIVVDAAGKDGAEGDPQEHDGPPQGTAQGAEDGAEARDVKQLDHEQLPLGQDHVVHAVVDAHGGGFTVVRAEGIFYDFAVEEVTRDQDCQAEQKANHLDSSLKHIKFFE